MYKCEHIGGAQTHFTADILSWQLGCCEILEPLHFLQQHTPNLEEEIQCFPAGERWPHTCRCCLRPNHFTLDSKPPQSILEVRVWWSQQHHIICKEQGSDCENPKRTLIFLLAVRGDNPGGTQWPLEPCDLNLISLKTKDIWWTRKV